MHFCFTDAPLMFHASFQPQIPSDSGEEADIVIFAIFSSDGKLKCPNVQPLLSHCRCSAIQSTNNQQSSVVKPYNTAITVINMSKHERHCIKVKEWSASVAKHVHVLIYLTAFINFCTKIFYELHVFFPYKRPESKFDLA